MITTACFVQSHCTFKNIPYERFNILTIFYRFLSKEFVNVGSYFRRLKLTNISFTFLRLGEISLYILVGSQTSYSMP